MSTLQQPTNAQEQEEADFGLQLVWNLINGTVIAFGANEKGEIYLSVKKGEKVTEILIGVDERGEPAVFEVEKLPLQPHQPKAEHG